MKLENIIPGSKEWIEERKKRIQSTDAAPILGLSRYKNAYDVCLDKWGESPEQKETQAMIRGIVLQKVVYSAYERLYGIKLTPEFYAVHDTHEWMGATPDAGINKETHLQIKTHNNYIRDEYENGKVPISEAAQVLHEMAVCNTNSADLAILFGDTSELNLLAMLTNKLWSDNLAFRKIITDHVLEGDNFKIISCLRDEASIDLIIDAEKEFYFESVINKRLPPNAPTLKDSGNIRKATETETQLISHAAQLYKDKKKADYAYETITEALKRMIGEDTGIDAGDLGKVTYKQQSCTANYKAVAESMKSMLEMSDEEYERLVESCGNKKIRRFVVPYKKWCGD